MSETILAWHFVGEKLRNGEPIPANNELLAVDPTKLKLCSFGLHASINILDALKYAPGTTICRVELSGVIIKDIDKLVASERKILWRLNATKTLRKFACEAALSVIHLWDAPDIVIRYLKTQDERIRIIARSAAAYAAYAAAAYAAAAAADAAAAAAADVAADAAADAAADDAAAYAAYAAYAAADAAAADAAAADAAAADAAADDDAAADAAYAAAAAAEAEAVKNKKTELNSLLEKMIIEAYANA